MDRIVIKKPERISPDTIKKLIGENELSKWIADNIELLNEKLKTSISIGGIEEYIYGLKIDILGTDIRSQIPVVIENQFGKSNHDHLGKLITYTSLKDAALVIWIANDIQYVHRKALEWLNKKTPEHMLFYGIEVEFFRRGESEVSLNYNIIVNPPPNKRLPIPETTTMDEKYRAFFSGLREKVLSIDQNFSKAKALPQSWWGTSIGKAGFTVNSAFYGKKKYRVELYIDVGDKDSNKKAFEFLKEKRRELEKSINYELEWDKLTDKRACRISKSIDGKINDDESRITELINWSAPIMIQFKNTFAPLVKKYNFENA